MEQEKSFFRTVCALAVPVALQAMLQSSFGIIDQIMIGQLGSVSVAAVGLAGKFTSIYSVTVSAIGAVAGIMISQYLGRKANPEVRRSFFANLWIAAALAAVFTLPSVALPEAVMGLYIRDEATVSAAAGYLSIAAWTFVPMAGATMLSAMFRCMEKAALPLYASIGAAVLNTGLNYVLIFGKCGFAPMGEVGAAAATLISQWANFLIMLALFLPVRGCLAKVDGQIPTPFRWGQYGAMLLPVLACEVLWSLGENVYAAIYGHLGTESSAAMTLINPVQGLMTGALCGLSQAAAVIVGKRLGGGDGEGAYDAGRRLIRYGAAGALILSVLVVLSRGLYVQIYQVEPVVKELTKQILLAYALVAPFKVLNMILGGGIIRSGGKTQYVMVIDIIGTWGFGVPLGLLSAFVWKLSIPWVYFILSLEECVRFAISMAVFRSRKWMRQLET